jgi:uncharacterized membrane protein
MKYRLFLFLAVFFTALAAGASFVVWIDFKPMEMSPHFYVEKMQHAIKVFTIPLPLVLILAAFFNVLSFIFLRRYKKLSFLVLAAAFCIIAGILITVFGNVPINNQIKTWNIDSPPDNWKYIQHQWWIIHTVRTITLMAGLCLVLFAIFGNLDIKSKKEND